MNPAVAAGYLFHVFQADVLPLPLASRDKRRHFTTTNSKAKQQFQQMKNDCNLFSCSLPHKFVTADWKSFIAHENHPWPPAFSLHGKLRLTSSKHELLHCIESHFQPETPSHFDAKVFDGAATVHALPLDNTATFGEYSDTIFIPWTERQLTTRPE